jgi:hypothetical protein
VSQRTGAFPFNGCLVTVTGSISAQPPQATMLTIESWGRRSRRWPNRGSSLCRSRSSRPGQAGTARRTGGSLRPCTPGCGREDGRNTCVINSNLHPRHYTMKRVMLRGVPMPPLSVYFLFRASRQLMTQPRGRAIQIGQRQRAWRRRPLGTRAAAHSLVVALAGSSPG